MLSEQQMQSNWDQLIEIISGYSDGTNRWSKLLDFYNKHQNRIGLMPASGKEMFHSCFVGGYVAHVLNVYNSAFKLKDLWNEMGAIQDFTDEELAFVSVNYNIGKMGTEGEDYYIPQDDQWRRKNLGEIYKNNPAVEYMADFDRSLFILQSIGVTVTSNEFLSIKLHGGLYSKGNESYLINFSEEYKLRTNLPYIMHQADLLSARIEGQTQSKTTPKAAIKSVFNDAPKLGNTVAPKLVSEVKKKSSILSKYK